METKGVKSEQPGPAASGEERAQLAGGELTGELTAVSARLREAQKILRRDWAALSPRQRSEQSRCVRALELQQQALLEEIEMGG